MKTIYLLLITVLLFSCSKQDAFLDTRSNIADVVPETLSDYQAILNNDAVLNAGYPSLGLLGTDNFYLLYAAWQASLTTQERNAYIWAADIYEGARGADWQNMYQVAAYANISLEGTEDIAVTDANRAEWNNVRGSALFFRAFAFYELAQLFARPYDAATAGTDLGIPLKLSGDVNEKPARSTLAQTYERIFSDVTAAIELLPVTATYKTRPSKAAALALRARVTLTMGNYTQAQESAGAALAINASLVDFNTISATASVSFPAYPNSIPEVLFYATGISYGLLGYSSMKVDTLLYRSYAANDLRRTVFYTSTSTGIAFKGDYAGTAVSAKFSGFAVNELYLIRAETYARLGNTTAAMADLNTLLAKRWKTGTFVPLTAASAAEALNKILEERRREIPFASNLRWEDLRRLNKEPAYARTLTRLLNGITYTLPPNDQRYVYPIPDIEIQLSGIAQNPR